MPITATCYDTSSQFVIGAAFAVPRGGKMPNGRSGGFVIKTADLKELVKAVSDTTVVGQVVVLRLPFRAAEAAEVTRLVEECQHDRVAVEEQGHKGYVIHLSNEP